MADYAAAWEQMRVTSMLSVHPSQRRRPSALISWPRRRQPSMLTSWSSQDGGGLKCVSAVYSVLENGGKAVLADSAAMFPACRRAIPLTVRFVV